MKKLFVTFTLAFALIGQNLQGADRYVTYLKSSDNTTSTVTIAADEVATVMLFFYESYSSRPSISVTIGASTISLAQFYPNFHANGAGPTRPLYPGQWAVAGPATINFTGNAAGKAILTVKISPNPNIMGVKQ